MELLRDVVGDVKDSHNIALVVLLDSEGRELWRIGPGRPFSRSAVKQCIGKKKSVGFSDILYNGKPETGVFWKLQFTVVVPIENGGKTSGYLYFDSGIR